MTRLKLTNYKVLSTGADGGHQYISADIEYNGVVRQITALFKYRSDEEKLSEKSEIIVKGMLVDDGLQFSLMFLDTEIVDEG